VLYAIIEINDQAIKKNYRLHAIISLLSQKTPWILLFAADYHRLWYYWMDLGLSCTRKPGVGDLILTVSDTLIAAQTSVIAAQALGLGSCYIGDIIENAEIHRELLKLPRYVFPAALLCFGYLPDHFSRPKTPRLPLDAILHTNQYQKKKIIKMPYIPQNAVMKNFALIFPRK